MQSASGDALDELFQEYERLSLHFEVAGGFDVEHRTDEVLMGLGFSSEQMDEPVPKAHARRQDGYTQA